MKISNRIIVVVALLTIIFGGVTWALASDEDTIYSCVNTRNGAIKIVNSAEDCKKQWEPLIWNKEGPQGPPGPGTDRYVDFGDGTVLDRHTGLVWLKDANCADLSPNDWNAANASVAGLESGMCGLDDGSWAGDWRLPTKIEWMATVSEGRALGCTYPALTDEAGTGCFADGTQWATNVQSEGCGYWSGTSLASSPDVAAYVFLNLGGFGPGGKSNNCFNVWPVRGGPIEDKLQEEAELQVLKDRISALEGLLSHFSREGNEIFITGANLHVVNGTGTTVGSPNGLGNVIVGYNELRGDGTDNRSGSHMLVLGTENNYSSFGGIVLGEENNSSAWYNFVTGLRNTASEDFASVNGGQWNTASADFSTVSGGLGNTASGSFSTVSGGQYTTCSDWYSWCGGGIHWP